MRSLTAHPVILGLLGLMVFIACVFVVNYLIITHNGTPVAAPDIPRGPETYGQGKPITYVVLGDSTTVGQGADYDRSIARETARHLGTVSSVTLHNLGVSGARAADVRARQVPQAVRLKPDVVLVAVTANDVTHLTSLSAVRQDLLASIQALRQANPTVRIVLTGAPQMGSVPRFPEPTKSLARLRTAQVNRMVERLALEERVRFAPIAAETGQAFLDNPKLFAADNFHPNADGYRLWVAVLNRTLF